MRTDTFLLQAPATKGFVSHVNLVFLRPFTPQYNQKPTPQAFVSMDGMPTDTSLLQYASYESYESF
jgi:hypothetical protein